MPPLAAPGPVQRSTSTSTVARAGALAELGGALVEGQHVGIAVLASVADRPRPAGSYQAPRRKPHHARRIASVRMRAGEARAAIVVHAHHIAIGDAARRRVGRIDRRSARGRRPCRAR